MHVEIVDYYFYPSLWWLADIFNMLTYTAATSHVADICLRRVRVRFSVTVYTQLAVGVYWDSTPLTASVEIFKVYICFTIFRCDCTLIYTLMYCVCQHTDPGMAQIHTVLTRFESGRYKNKGKRVWKSRYVGDVSTPPSWKPCLSSSNSVDKLREKEKLWQTLFDLVVATMSNS